ncbi:Kelch-like protein 10 [Zootermopsis nevadensis]|uniref:Kelch-like protein 10 n=1 Tax=Zootermopsis nevadensis TaxID=136037 RepID=A0A067RGQ1_ZOONE|nr:Kelch-like protein 10 [Zootermopsis nevadensis]
MCAGGDNSTLYKLITEKYDPAEDTWTVIPYRIIPDRYFNVEMIDTHIVICDCYDVSEIYNEEERKWYQASKCNFCRYGMSICVVKDLPNAKDYAYKHTSKLI